MLREPRWLYWMFVLGVVTLATRAVLDSDFQNSALLYLGIPFLVALAIHHFLPQLPKEKKSRRVLNHLRNATVIMLATSAFLFEGFICILMFLPIYWVVTFVVFAAAVWSENKEGKAKLGIQLWPLLILFLAFEGTSPSLSLPRENVVIREQIVNADPQAILAHLSKPIEFPSDRNWFISIFPLPDKSETGTLRAGDTHRLHFSYNRWFVTNTQKGEMHVHLTKVSDHHIQTKIVRNDSYLANYLKLDGTNVRLIPIAGGRTRVQLEIRYTRLLDPAWYFGPMQRYAIESSADYLLQNIINPEKKGV